MRFLKSLLFALFSSAALVSAHGDHGDHSHSHDGDVLPLSSSSFKAEIEAHPLTLVEFFAPWCGHCKALAPQYADAATKLKGVATLASVDCTVERDLCSQHGVKGFPTLKVFRGSVSDPSDYTGGRQSDDIVKYMTKQNEPSYVKITSAAEAEDFLSRDGVKVFGFFPDEASDDEFVHVAEILRNDYSFAVASDPAVLAGKVEVTVPSVILAKDDEKGQDEFVHHSGALTSQAITEFVSAEAFPILGEIGPENFQKYLDRGLPLVWYFYNKEDKEHDNDNAEVARAAGAFKGQLSVVKLDGVRWAEHAKHFGIPAGHLPALVAEDRTEGKNYVFPVSSEVNEENVKAHLRGFVDKTLQPTLKSQEPPATQDGPVTVVVGKTFDEIVIKSDKDVFVEFYAPWCGHCKSLAPKYDQLANSLKEHTGIVIAKVDATENDTPARISGFPTLILYPAGRKDQPVQYEGDRTAEAMEEWLREHATTFGGAATKADDHDDL